MSWTYDPPSGTWQDPELSARLLAEASAPLPSLVLPDSSRGVEYGRAFADFDDPTTEAKIVEMTRVILAQARAFSLLPHVRRADASYWSCSCGAELAPPGEFGRDDAHLRPHEGHDKVWMLRPGKVCAVYAVAAAPEAA